MEQCKECKYWEETEDFRYYKGEDYDDYAVGFCHRYPQTLDCDDLSNKGFIETRDIDWCGEFQPKKPEPDKTPILDLCLSRRLENIFEREGFKTIGQLIEKPFTYFAHLDGLGEASHRELRRKLSEWIKENSQS